MQSSFGLWLFLDQFYNGNVALAVFSNVQAKCLFLILFKALLIVEYY